MSYKFTIDTAILSGACKYANMTGLDPGLGRKSTMLPRKIPTGYLGTKLTEQKGATRYFRLGTIMRLRKLTPMIPLQL